MKIWVLQWTVSLFEFLCINWIKALSTCVVSLMCFLWFLWGHRELHDMDGVKIAGPKNNFFSLEDHPITMFRKGRLAKKVSTVIQTVFLHQLGDGQVCAFKAMGFPILLTNNPDILRTILSGRFDEFPKASRYDRLRTFLRDGLVTSQGLKWKVHRSIINKGFDAAKFKVMVQVFIDTISDRVVEWKKDCTDAATASNNSINSVEINANLDMSSMTTVIICKTAFSYTLDSKAIRGEGSPFGDVNLLLDEINRRLTQPTNWWHHLDPKQERLVNVEKEKTDKLIDKIIAARLLLREEMHATATVSAASSSAIPLEPIVNPEGTSDGDNPKDLLDILLDAGEEYARETGKPTVISPGELRDHILTFLAAGHETTSTTLQWIMYEVCLHPEAQKKVHEEVDAVLKGRQIEMDDIYKAFPYINQVIKETMRLHPAVPNIARTNRKVVKLEYTDGFGEKKKIMLPKNTNIACSISSLHRNPMYWNKPNEFNPDRFSDANIKDTLKASNFLYIPFSAGPRNCIGQRFASMELVAIFVTLMQHFKLSISDDNLEKITIEETVVQSPKNLFVTLTPR